MNRHFGEKIRIGISACLLGQSVRYDGSHRRSEFIVSQMGQWFEWVPVCPELEAGFGVPRQPLVLKEYGDQPHLVELSSGLDKSCQMISWIASLFQSNRLEGVQGWVVKSRSPSCGYRTVAVFGKEGTIRRGDGSGLFIRALLERDPLLPIIDEQRLHVPAQIYSWLKRVTSRAIWSTQLQRFGTPKPWLSEFHQQHRWAAFVCDESGLRELDLILESCKKSAQLDEAPFYFKRMLEILATPVNRERHAAVLCELAGRFIKAQRWLYQFYREVQVYSAGQLPLIVPVRLLQQKLVELGYGWAAKDRYLSPSLAELFLGYVY